VIFTHSSATDAQRGSTRRCYAERSGLTCGDCLIRRWEANRRATGSCIHVRVAAALVTLRGVADYHRKLRPVVGTGCRRSRIAGRSRTTDRHAVFLPLIAQRAVPSLLR